MADASQTPYRSTLADRQDSESLLDPPASEESAWIQLRLRECVIAIGLVAMIVTGYWTVWRLEFVFFDDPGYVTDNLNVVRGLPLFKNFNDFKASFYWAFTAFEQSNWHPLTWLSHMLDVQVYQLWPGGHHITNIIFHSMNTLLLFWLFNRMTGKVWRSAAVAAMFAVHPMHVESVAWVAERKDVLCTCLGLLTMNAYVSYARKADFKNDAIVVYCGLTAVVSLLGVAWYQQCFQGHEAATWLEEFGIGFVLAAVAIGVYAAIMQRWNLAIYFGVFVLYALGLLAKPMLVTLPALLLLLDFWPLGRLWDVAESSELKPHPVDRNVRSSTPRRRAKRNQRLPSQPVRQFVERSSAESPLPQIILRGFVLMVEKMPLFALAAMSSIVTPIAQAHGGSMASRSELSIPFRLANSVQSYVNYMGRMVWPGKMMSLHLLVLDVNVSMVVWSVFVMVLLTSVAIAAFVFGRRYATFGWLWYVGTLIPVIGLVQVGEQAMADRYTYIPYIGLFVAIVWAIGDLMECRPFLRRALTPVVTLATFVVLASWTAWTNYQIQTWQDVPTHLRHALSVEPDNWNMLNNYGVWLWKESQKQDAQRVEFMAAGNAKGAAECEKESQKFKLAATESWNHGVTVRPTATDIHSNLGYAFSEKAENESRKGNQAAATEALDAAEAHLKEAVRLKPISSRPHNNLGRVLLKRGKQDESIAEFNESIRLDPSLLEAHLNVAQVYRMKKDLDASEKEYKAILGYYSESVVDKETLSNFCQAFIGLADIESVRNNGDKAVEYLVAGVHAQPTNFNVRQALALTLLQQGKRHPAEEQLWVMLQLNPDRGNMAEGIGMALKNVNRIDAAVVAWNFMAWAFATSPEPTLRNGKAALFFAKRVCEITKGQDPSALDSWSAALAESGQFDEAVRYAQQAIDLAVKLDKKPLADAIRGRMELYKNGKPYISKIDGSDRPD